MKPASKPARSACSDQSRRSVGWNCSSARAYPILATSRWYGGPTERMRYGVEMERPALAPFKPTERRRGLHPALRNPVRVGIWLGGASLVVGSMLGWLQVWLPYQGWSEISSFERAGDGLIALELGILLVALGWSDRAADSRLAIVVVAPLVAGLAAFVVMRLAYNDGAIYI